MVNCIECGQRLINYRALRCKKCANKGINNPNYKEGKHLNNKKCQDCGDKISTASSIRCVSCTAKISTTCFQKGANHPNWMGGITKLKDYDKNYIANKRKTDLHYKLRCRIGTLLRGKLKRRLLGKSNKTSVSVLGFTIDDLKRHLEKQFKNGMSWENMHLWHIDHIKQDCTFNYTSINDEEFKLSWKLSNLRPLWAKENQRRSKRGNT